jgi:hypothetical protein
MSKRLLNTQRIVNLSSDPSVGHAGEMYYNTVDGVLKFHNGTIWQAVGTGGVTVSPTAPSNPQEGDQWFDSNDANLYIFYDNFWVEVGGGAAAQTLAGLDDVQLTSATAGQVLTYDGSTWKNATPTGGGGGTSESNMAYTFWFGV